MIMRYVYAWYAWAPAVIFGGVVVLILPWLAVFALLALLVPVVAALWSLVRGFVAVLRALGRSTLHHPHNESKASDRLATDSAHVAGTATVFASAASSYTPSLLTDTDQTLRLEEAGFDPLEIYEYPHMSDYWPARRPSTGR
jgi:hypothetical protein